MLPLEIDILQVASRLARRADPEFYGFLLATELRDGNEARGLLSHGSLYKALARLEAQGLLASRWEDIDESEAGRPRRRLYRVTAEGAAAYRAASRPVPGSATAPRLAGA